MSYYHLSIEERACIYQFMKLGMSIRKIATALNRSPSTISREIKRNSYSTGINYAIRRYFPKSADRKYKERRLHCHRKTIFNDNYKICIEEKIALTWSPEQISNREKDMPSFSTIYNWINKGYLIKGDKTKLRRKGKFKRPQETRGKFNIGKTIKKRPKEVYTRNSIGHWEADTVESGRRSHKRKSKYCFVTLVERKSRKYIAKLIPDRTAENVTKAIVEILSEYPPEHVKTITCDRGKEFAGYEEIEEKLKCDVYFADPYCAWQKGTNENSNGLLREFYPKGMDLSKVDESELEKNLDLMNNRPRKCIGYKTPNEVIEENTKCCT